MVGLMVSLQDHVKSAVLTGTLFIIPVWVDTHDVQ